MSVQLLRGYFLMIDGACADDFEVLDEGAITLIPQVNGNAGCVLLQGTFSPRE